MMLLPDFSESSRANTQRLPSSDEAFAASRCRYGTKNGLSVELQQRGNEEHHVLKVRSHLLGRLANIHVGQEALVAALLLRIPLVQLAVPILLAVLEASNLSTIVESNAHRHRVVGVDACVDVLHEPQNE